jgi:hypothetical protein
MEEKSKVNPVIREAMKIASKDVKPPKCVRDGLVDKSPQPLLSEEEIEKVVNEYVVDIGDAHYTKEVIRERDFEFLIKGLHKAFATPPRELTEDDFAHQVFEVANKLATKGYGNVAVMMHGIHRELVETPNTET